MLNFKIIEPTDKKDGKKLTNKILKNLIPLEKKTNILQNNLGIAFIITESPTRTPRTPRTILGGACLLKKNLTSIQADVRELIRTPTLYSEGVWECSSLLNENEIIFENAYYRLTNSSLFSTRFYSKLVEFGQQKGIEFIVMKLPKEIYLATKDKQWPYVIELRPENSYDNLFHGVLPLAGKQYDNYKKELNDAQLRMLI